MFTVPVFPVREKDESKTQRRKMPYITQWQKRATTDAKQIAKWKERWPGCLWGMPTGSRSGLVAIDLDSKDDTLYNHLPKEARRGLVQETQRGRHLIFRYAGADIRNSASRIAPGIDVRGEGGYIVIAPSPGYTLHGKLEDAPAMPDAVAALLRCPEQAPTTKDSRLDPDGIATPDEVIHALHLLDPADFASYEAWTRVMLMCRHASQGDENVKEAFKQWSRGDEFSFDDNTDAVVDYQWLRSDTSRQSVLTFKSLKHEVRRRRGYYAGPTEAQAEELTDIDEPERVVENARLQRMKTGTIKKNMFNCVSLLEGEFLKGEKNPLFHMCRWNEIAYRPEFDKAPPWVSGSDATWRGRGVGKDDYTRLIAYLSDQFKADFTADMVMCALDVAAKSHYSYHPVQHYLQALTWDGIPRLSKWFIDIAKLDARNTYNSFVPRKFIIGAVARAMNPGCQMDNMLVLEGKQGTRKTSLVRALGGEWYRSPTLKTLGDKEAILACLGAWFCEIEEMSAAKGTHIDALKKFITGNKDTVRFVYDRVPSDIPRSCVLIGTMNPCGTNTYIHDSTGGRRFWPIRIEHTIDTDAFERMRDQLFAEAMVAYLEGEKWHLDAESEKIAKNEQSQRLNDHPWSEIIREYYEEGEGRSHVAVQASDVWLDVMGRPIVQFEHESRNAIGRVMRHTLGWQVKTVLVDKFGKRVGFGKRRTAFMRPEPDFGDLE